MEGWSDMLSNRKSIYLDCIGPGTLEERLKAAAEAGFAAVELPTLLPEERQQAKALFQKYNLICPSIMTAGAWENIATSPDPAVRERSAECYKRAVDTAVDMGCDTILCVPGGVNAQISYEQALENAPKTLRLVLPYAEEKGVTLAIENVWNKFLVSPLEMTAFIDSFHSRYVASYFDIGNIAFWGIPQQWIHTLGGRIKRVHIKGFRMKDFSGFTWSNLPDSTIDWAAVRQALEDVGYDSFITAELSPDERGLAAIAEDIDRIFH